MSLRPFLSHFLVVIAATVAVVSLLHGRGLSAQQHQPVINDTVALCERNIHLGKPHQVPPLTPQVVVGTPQAVLATPPPQRYTYLNEFPANRSHWLPLYTLIHRPDSRPAWAMTPFERFRYAE